MTDEERVRKQTITRRIRRGVVATGLIGTLGVTGFIGAQAASEAASTVSVQSGSATSGSSSPQQWSVQGPSFGSGLGSPHAATGAS